jgi:hypothetical protein
MAALTLDQKINHFAYTCFRDVADGDYIAARMALRAGLVSQYLWASQQAIEKYLKCILILNRVPRPDPDLRHDLERALALARSSVSPQIELTKPTSEYIDRIDSFGRFRYQEISQTLWSTEIIPLDRTVWELRRYCATDDEPKRLKLREGVVAPRVRLNGFLEKVLARKQTDAARKALTWQNGFFGNRRRKTVSLALSIRAINTPLFTFPEILDEVLKYVYVPADVQKAFRQLAQEREAAKQEAAKQPATA